MKLQLPIDLAALGDNLTGVNVLPSTGRVSAIQGPVVLARIPHAALGDYCQIELRDGKTLPAQVVAFSDETFRLAPFAELQGVSPGAAVHNTGTPLRVRVGTNLIGQVLNPLGLPISSNQIPKCPQNEFDIEVDRPAPCPLERRTICSAFNTGVSSIDGLCTIGIGQRIGIFAGAGTGKSTLLGMIARNSAAEVNVIALVGERGREVNDFINEALGATGLKKSVLVVSTSDEPPLRRFLAIMTATAIAEHYRSCGKKVLLMVDSLTRVARAIRDVSLATGEVPIRHGYTPSVYAQMPRLLERTGASATGVITAIYTVLTNGEQDCDPLGEEIKSLLDGHIVLDSSVAHQGIRPAIDILSSVSRLMNRLNDPEYLYKTEIIRTMLNRLRKDRDLLLFGGTPDKELSAALELENELKAVLNQPSLENRPAKFTREKLSAIAERLNSKCLDSAK